MRSDTPSTQVEVKITPVNWVKLGKTVVCSLSILLIIVHSLLVTIGQSISSNSSTSTFGWVDITELSLILLSMVDFIGILLLFKDYRWSIIDAIMILSMLVLFIIDVTVHDHSSQAVMRSRALFRVHRITILV